MMRAVVLAAVAVPAMAAAQRPAPLTMADQNRIIPVRIGQTLTVHLRQSAGTGSTWRMVPARGLALAGAPVLTGAGPAGTPIAGGPQTVSFRVHVTMGGELALTFVNTRTFGGLDQSAETATFIVEAR